MLDAHFTHLFFSPAVTRWAIIGFQLERPGASSRRWRIRLDGIAPIGLFYGEIAESIELVDIQGITKIPSVGSFTKGLSRSYERSRDLFIRATPSNRSFPRRLPV